METLTDFSEILTENYHFHENSDKNGLSKKVGRNINFDQSAQIFDRNILTDCQFVKMKPKGFFERIPVRQNCV